MNKIGYRPTWAQIDLGNLCYNYRQIRRLLKPSTRMLVTVKADAYGHGLVPVSRKLVACGVEYLGVASIDEGVTLRNAGIRAPILVLGMILPRDVRPLFQYALTPTVCTLELASALNRHAARLKKRVKAHVKVDTGMGRLGVLQADALALVRAISRLKSLEMEGIFTHFAFADLDEEFTLYQLRLFATLLASLRNEGIRVPFVHAANSMGIFNFRNSHFTMVRPGLVMYGLRPAASCVVPLKPVLSLKTRVVYHKRVPAGFGLSYGQTYVTKKETTIVTLPVGYGDGYPRNLSNAAPVLIGGKKYRISGRICMDQILVDVGDAKVKAGDEVVLIGTQGKNSVTAEALAALAGTIPYEIVCGFGSRIPRIYI